jgi:hypothetical protein
VIIVADSDLMTGDTGLGPEPIPRTASFSAAAVKLASAVNREDQQRGGAESHRLFRFDW